jgi:hypothetical protein
MKSILIGLGAVALFSAACGGNNDNTPPDAGPPAATCIANPATSTDLLNSCTDAGFIDKKPVLPLLQADGGLPPLP